jgi:hypothetical protein
MLKNPSEKLSAIWEYALKMCSPTQPYAEKVLKTPVLNGVELSVCPGGPVQRTRGLRSNFVSIFVVLPGMPT